MSSNLVFSIPEITLPIVESAQRFAVRRVYCVGRNYLEHIREFGNDEREPPFFFAKHRDSIEGVLVSLPNFGDERGVAETLKLSGLRVPILIQGYPDDLDRLEVSRRRDAFCGKISVCNNLKQAGIPFSLTAKHVVRPGDPAFQKDLAWFAGVCRVVSGLRNARLGAVGARPGAFNTVRYSEKILERNGIKRLIHPLPFTERTVRNWDASPYLLDDGNDLTEADPTVWLLPYWMGRYHRLIE